VVENLQPHISGGKGAENRRFSAATLLGAGIPPKELSTTTAVKKFIAGTVVIPLPNGKKVESKGQSAGEHLNVSL
jgi:hypothetical protein